MKATQRSSWSAMVACLVIPAAMALPAHGRGHGEEHRGPHAEAEAGKDIAYYTLALSWSPSFCESPQGRNARDQCGPGRQFSFVVHGLWPQYEKGWPEACSSRFGDELPPALVQANLDMMPSPRLIEHEWRTHGTCSGLDPQAYFQAARSLHKAIAIPDAYRNPTRYITTTPAGLKAEFLVANPRLTPDMLSVTCKGRNLTEVRVCFDTSLKPRPCGQNEAKQCRSPELVLPPVRGGN